MYGRYHPQLVVDCVVSFTDNGLTGEAHIFDHSFPGCPRPSEKVLEQGDYVQLWLRLPDREKPVPVPLAAIRWANGSRFGVEVVLIDADDEMKLNRYVSGHSETHYAYTDWRREIVLTAAA